MVFAFVTTSTQTLVLMKAEGLIGDKQFIAILSENHKGQMQYKGCDRNNLLPLILNLYHV
jgi:hypothetical protein